MREAELPVAWLFDAEALFLGNALSLRSVRSVDGQTIGDETNFAAANKGLGFD